MTDLVTEGEPVAAPESESQAAPAVEASILGSLRQARNKIGAGSEPLFRSVPGYDDKLVVRYKWIPYKSLTRTAQQLSKITEPSEQQVAAAADAIAATCEEVCVRLSDAGKKPPLGFPKDVFPLSTNGVPITFADADRLSYALGFKKPDNTRDVAIRVFNNEYALIEEAAIVVEWLKDTTRKVDAEFVGE